MLTARHRIIAVLAGLVLVVAACSSSDDAGEGAESEPQEIAPIFAVETTDGQFSLSDHLATDGRPVEMPAIDASAEQHPEVAFVGVSVQDSRSDAEEFAEEIGVAYTLGFDDEGSVDEAYAPLGLPASYLISADGIIVEQIFGTVTEEDLAEKFAEHFG